MIVMSTLAYGYRHRDKIDTAGVSVDLFERVPKRYANLIGPLSGIVLTPIFIFVVVSQITG